MDKLILFFLIFILAACSCKDDQGDLDDKSEIKELPIIWKRSLHKGDVFNSNTILKRSHLTFDQGIIIATTEGPEDRYINMIDPETGEDIWKWNNIYQAPTEKFYISDFYEYNNILHYIVGSRHYWIDLNSGSTYKRLRRDRSFRHELTGIGSKYYSIGFRKDTFDTYETYVAYEGDFLTGELTLSVVPDFLVDHAQADRIGQVGAVQPIVKDGKDYLLVSWQDIFPNWHFVTYLQLYDNTDKKWVYDKVVLNEPSQKGVLFQPLKVVGDKVFIQVENSILCHNIWNGEQIWGREFPHDFSFSGFIVEEGVLVGNCENTVLYGLNAESGEILWESQGSGTSSKLEGRYLNGVVYFSGGAPRKVFATDIHTGQTLWALESQRLGSTEEWKGDIYVVPGKNGQPGKVIACTHMFAYCFEAAR